MDGKAWCKESLAPIYSQPSPRYIAYLTASKSKQVNATASAGWYVVIIIYIAWLTGCERLENTCWLLKACAAEGYPKALDFSLITIINMTYVRVIALSNGITSWVPVQKMDLLHKVASELGYTGWKNQQLIWNRGVSCKQTDKQTDRQTDRQIERRTCYININ